MEFDLAEQRAGAREQLRIADLMSLAPGGDRVLEIGARDCYLSRRLTALYGEVTALDLRKPEIDEPGIVPVQGDVTALDFADGSFDTVFCAEVLEHVPPQKLRQKRNNSPPARLGLHWRPCHLARRRGKENFYEFSSVCCRADEPRRAVV